VFKWLLILLGAIAFYQWLKAKQRAMHLAQQSSVRQSPPLAESMAQCDFCGVYLPWGVAIHLEGRHYCSNDHFHRVDEQGWIGAALWRESPNQDLRPEGVVPDLVVIHHISLPPGEFRNHVSTANIVDFFQNRLNPALHPYFAEIANQKVSSHFLISREGELIQFVSTQRKAWHAGISSFLGRDKCNDFSIGIELEGDGETPFEASQYQSLRNLVDALGSRYPNLHFAGHSDIAPDRKTDPGIHFSWENFQKNTDLPLDRFPFGLHSR